MSTAAEPGAKLNLNVLNKNPRMQSVEPSVAFPTHGTWFGTLAGSARVDPTLPAAEAASC